MLVDPPPQYHDPLSGWVRFDHAIDDIPEVRHAFIDWLNYGVECVYPDYSLTELDWIELTAGPFTLMINGEGITWGQPPSSHPEHAFFKQIESCVIKAQRLAREHLYDMIGEGIFRVYARKHEPDANLQSVPKSVWEATAGARDARECWARLKTGKLYYDVHFERIERVPEPAQTSETCDDEPEQVADERKLDRLISEMRRVAPDKLTRDKAKALLGFIKEKRAKEFAALWRKAGDLMNADAEAKLIRLAGRYGRPDGNPLHAKIRD